MKIIKFSAENIKKLRAVEINPEGNVIEIVGGNGSGKSSVLDAIFYALSGAAAVPSRVVRDGEEKAVIKLDLGELIVTRRFNKDGGTGLTVEAKNGARFPSPQRMLDDLVGTLSFDPLEFMRMDRKTQVAALRKLAQFDVDLDKLDAEIFATNGMLTAKRTDLRITQNNLVGIPAVPNPEALPDELTDPQTVFDEMAVAIKKTEEVNQEQVRRAEIVRLIGERRRRSESLKADAQEFKKRAQELLQKALDSETLADQLAADATESENDLNELKPLEMLPDLAIFKQRSTDLAKTNNLVTLKLKRRQIEARITELHAKIEEITVAGKQLQDQRNAAIARAQMPIGGLSFGESEVIYQGRPLVNASSAEQLLVSVSIAMAANPKLRIIRIKDGSLLDGASQTMLKTLAASEDYQIWIEMIDHSGANPCVVVMEDGDSTTFKNVDDEGVK